MGREAQCICTWGASSARVKALLETGELILRGPIRHKVPFSEMEQVRTEEDRLIFCHHGEVVCLILGDVTASKWNQVIHAPPVTVARKLGITPKSFVWSLGETDDVELETALSTAQGLRSKQVDVIVACVNTMDGLANALRKTAVQVGQGVPLWIVYPKGKGHAVSESEVRSAARAIGLIDTKVVSISSTHTGLRFNMRK